MFAWILGMFLESVSPMIIVRRILPVSAHTLGRVENKRGESQDARLEPGGPRGRVVWGEEKAGAGTGTRGEYADPPRKCAGHSSAAGAVRSMSCFLRRYWRVL